MALQEIIKPDGVLCNATARSKKHCLEILSELLVRNIPDVASDDIFECLIGRERLHGPRQGRRISTLPDKGH